MDTLLNIHLRPLPPLRPLAAPPGMLNLFAQRETLELPAVPQEQVEDEQAPSYRLLYQQKCEQELSLKGKIDSHEEVIKILQQKNSALESQVARLQEERWKKFDYSRLSARGRFKSQKRVPPTIDVRVPHRMNQQQEILIEEEKYIKTDRDGSHEDIAYYKQEIREYRQENKRLKEEISRLNKAMGELMAKGDNYGVASSVNNKSRTSRSPIKGEWSQMNACTPVVSSFSPFPQESQTVKKDMSARGQNEGELKRLKNEILYKDLMLDKLRTEHAKEGDILRKHLALSVTESQKIADQTTTILNSFKSEIIRLTQQLLHYKKLHPNIEVQRRQNIQERAYGQKELVSILKARRAERISH